MLARPETTARWAPVGLGVVLLVLTGLAVWVGVSTSRAADAAARANETSAAFDDARFAVSEQESLARKYRSSRRPRSAASTSPGRDMTAALRAAAASGDPRQRAVVRSVLMRQTAYLASIDRMFAAKDAGRPRTWFSSSTGARSIRASPPSSAQSTRRRRRPVPTPRAPCADSTASRAWQ